MKLNHPQITWENGLPHSVLFNDKYFCEENGLLESQYVFCEGNHLEERWKNLSSENPGTFTIGETGFGTGLNFLCAWKLWQACAPKNWMLHYISIEKYPLSVEDLKKSLQLWPTIIDYSSQLIELYAQLPNVPFVGFDDGKVKLTVIFDRVLAALDHMRKHVHVIDAWFLDGFAPAKNPDMWSQDVFTKMAALSRPGTTLGTFTVAGTVRRGLINQGFILTKVEGFGQKRHMLRGVFK